MLLGALRSDQDLFSIPARYLPARWEWSNLVEVWSQVPLLAYLRATLVIAGVTTLIVLVVSLPTAWYTARHRFRGRNLFLYLILATQMFAPVALVVGLYREYTLVDTVMANVGLGLRATSSYWAIILVYSAFNLAFAVWILSGYFRSISREIEEAALIDGLGRLKVLLRVVLPLAKPGVVTVPIFTLRVDPAGEPCGCGGRGCVETVASAAAIARRYAARTGRPVAGAAAVAARVRKGDPDAVAVWEEAVGALAEGSPRRSPCWRPGSWWSAGGSRAPASSCCARSPSCCACGCRRTRRACPGWWAPPSGTRPAAWARRCWPGARSTAARRRDGHDRRGGGLNPARGRPVTPAPGTGAGCSARRAAPRRRPRSGRTAAAGRRRTARSGGP
jgi:ABC-type tungstate transport system substrate-binding protein